THAYALMFLKATRRYLVEMDDDILGLQQGWDEEVEKAFSAFPRLGFLALDVVQDRFTDGAKRPPEYYTAESAGGVVLEHGQAGGWFAVTPRHVYDAVGGFLYEPGNPFVWEDAWYRRKMRPAGFQVGILKNVFAYHACGASWNAAFGYHQLWR